MSEPVSPSSPPENPDFRALRLNVRPYGLAGSVFTLIRRARIVTYNMANSDGSPSEQIKVGVDLAELPTWVLNQLGTATDALVAVAIEGTRYNDLRLRLIEGDPDAWWMNGQSWVWDNSKAATDYITTARDTSVPVPPSPYLRSTDAA